MKKVLMMAGLAVFSIVSVVAAAAQTIVVTPANAAALGWSTADTRAGGTVAISGDQPIAGNGSLKLTTDGTDAAKAQYMHAANVPLDEVTALSYTTYQQSGAVVAAPSYQLPICALGVDPDLISSSNGAGCIGGSAYFVNLVYEPYWNGAVVPTTEQSWDVDAGQFWSSKTINAGTCQLQNGAGGPPFYSLNVVSTMCPDAVVVGFGVNIGTYNPNYVVFADLVNFNGTTYNFELYQAVTTANQCKNGGWQAFTRPDGSTFNNQGDCVSFTKNGK